MRSPLIAGLLAAATVSAKGYQCGQQQIGELVESKACGDNALISQCIRQIDISNQNELVSCFEKGGCTEGDAAWFAEACATAGPRPDLKMREAAATLAHPILARQTTAAAAAAAAAAATTAATSGPLVCSTTFTTTVEICTTTTDADKHIGSTCSQGPRTTSACAPGMLCFTDSIDESKRVCMRRDDSLSTGGLIVAIAFAFGLIATIGSLIAMSRMEKSRAKKEARERAALLGGSKKAMEDVESAKPYRIGGGGESGADTGDAADQAPLIHGSGNPQIKLHQGLGGLGEPSHAGGDQHWSNDYAAARK